MIAATHGRSLWVVDIAALEQMTPKVIAAGTYLFKPKTAYQWGEGPQLNLPGNGFAQAEMTYANPPFGADIVYRLAANAPGNVRLVDLRRERAIRSRSINGPGGAGRAPRRRGTSRCSVRATVAELSPSQRRDSILLRARAPQVLDSLQKAGYDTAAIRTVRQQVAS